MMGCIPGFSQRWYRARLNNAVHASSKEAGATCARYMKAASRMHTAANSKLRHPSSHQEVLILHPSTTNRNVLESYTSGTRTPMDW